MFPATIAFLRRRRPGVYSVSLARSFLLPQNDGMWFLTILEGLSAGLRVQESPLYRHPYRSADEAIRGDGKRIAGDMMATMERTDE